jgi:hypothetical protein
MLEDLRDFLATVLGVAAIAKPSTPPSQAASPR